MSMLTWDPHTWLQLKIFAKPLMNFRLMCKKKIKLLAKSQQKEQEKDKNNLRIPLVAWSSRNFLKHSSDHFLSFWLASSDSAAKAAILAALMHKVLGWLEAEQMVTDIFVHVYVLLCNQFYIPFVKTFNARQHKFGQT